VLADNVSKRFGPKSVLNGISLVAESGDIVGILGKNGAGKTTLIDVLLGFSPPTSGNARLFGEKSTALRESVKARIGFAPQQDELIDVLTGAQQLAATASFYRTWDSGLVARLAAEWAVPLDRKIQAMSVGERQKLSLLLALGHRPELLVLDEPVASLDPIARRQFLSQIAELSIERAPTILFSTHIVSDLERVAGKVWIIRDGTVAWQGELDTLRESVVRLHVHSKRPLPLRLDIPETISSRVNGGRATVAVMHWDGDGQATLARRLDAEIEVEALGVEDIFLELHS